MTNSYDELPYTNNAFAATHPVRLATVATLHGLTPPDPRQCRVLELGCGRGGNLLPMAETLPESRFVGIDLSTRHIDEARASARELGFVNIEFHAMNILELETQLGEFDYIIAHGVYSWVPEEVQQKILELCQSLLTPHGIAYISYNTLPGWHYRGVVRDMLGYHVSREAPASVQVEQARSFLEFVSKAIADRDGVRSRMLRGECESLAEVPASYLYHEHLESHNRACYFHEFAAQLEPFSLQYVGEAQAEAIRTGFPPGATEAIRRMRPQDRIWFEQHLDFLTHGTFRRSLLARSGVPVSESMVPEAIANCWLTSDAQPVDDSLSLPVAKPIVFRTKRNVEITTEHPQVQAAICELNLRAPRPVPFDELAAAVAVRLGGAGSEPFTSELKQTLLACYLQAMVEVRIVPPQICLEVTPRPRASGCALLQARSDSGAPNRAHQTVDLDPMFRFVLSQLNGSRSRDDIRDALIEEIRSGHMTIENSEGESLAEPGDQEHWGRVVDTCLERLASLWFLVG